MGPDPARWLSVCRQAGIRYLVVNGACEADWPVVRELARQPLVLPSFGYHPWYLHERTAGWLEQLEIQLDAVPSAVGEIGLDRWKPDLPYEPQEAAFLAQLAIAARRNLPASIHCLQAWGRMLELLQQHPRPATGFLLHSYGGPPEMIPAFAKLGAYFSFPGYFLHPRKERQRQTFKHVPADRLLVETDAPDQSLPADKVRFPLPDQAGRPVNHPANLPAVYAGLAEWLAEPLAVLAGRVETNFLSLFGGVLRRQSGHHPAGGGKAESAGDKGG